MEGRDAFTQVHYSATPKTQAEIVCDHVWSYWVTVRPEGEAAYRVRKCILECGTSDIEYL